MARKTNKFTLRGDTMVDVVARRGKDIIVKEMTLMEAQNINKKKSWNYDIFQIGFHTYKNSRAD